MTRFLTAPILYALLALVLLASTAAGVQSYRLQAERATALTFRDCAARFIRSHAPGWRNAKHAQQWANSLET